ncbi:MAG TPA: lytic transglycosylase domain-containing protein [bacterium]|nr:lytic transglycosylase domain-containing protein [bacterium]
MNDENAGSRTLLLVMSIIALFVWAFLFYTEIAHGMVERDPPPVPQKLYHYAETIADKHNIDFDWFYRLVEAESGWKLYLPGGDGGKAYGLCQIHINTARSWGGVKGSDSAIAKRLLDPRKNLHTCAHILRYLLDIYNGNKLFATLAFNAGTAHVRYVRAVVMEE